MSFFKKLICKHEWTWHGWSYIKCNKCEKVEVNEAMNAKLQSEFWEKIIIPDDPIFGRDAINKLLRVRGRKI